MKILLLVTMMIFATSASAGLYKWVDDEGNMHYSQKRPLNKQYMRLKAPAAAPEGSKPLYPESITNKSNNVVVEETAKNEKIRADNCASAKKNLNNYTVYRRFRDKDGNISIINDKERAQKIESSKQAINNFCN